ncbi:DEAD/DEAH box helicase [Leptothoe kymatousa]|uniref:DEAD/DEAH box helicase n=1 Tax=Leptothoe kymatousa TAU-MAC 1615 TaxID=2364775 RepID=A0ABS5XYU6_9CYAN|nr:DEAD/DEAH box helicase [Leptothoe kymatousa]MBT9310794.1 DEAD/DEAH box helicase [Leptothoe kymatousa TAU-MAC 1615]
MTLSFADLGLSDPQTQHLEELGFKEPTPIQAQAIPHMLAGHDVVGLAQTGTGKTAAFSLPILEQININKRAVQALVLTPTRELAMQVCQAVQTLRHSPQLHVLPVYGGQSIERQLSQLRRGVHMVVGTPGRILDLLNRGGLKFDQLSWMVLDEADEMLNMGFIQDVENILSHAPAERQTAFFSATMEPTVRELAAKFLQSPVTVKVKAQNTAPKRISQLAYVVPPGWSKPRALMPILEMEDPESAIIFVRTRRTAAELTRQLQFAGHSVDEYHGDLNQAQRERLLLRFKQGQVKWVVATDIAARGIHVDNLTHVINYELPDNLDSYVHRIGRTGRAGQEGRAVSIVHPLEKYQVRQIEQHLKQELTFCKVPTRAEIAARSLEKLQTQMKEAVTSERLASFLPIVSQLTETYDPHTVAAAALQMAYDQTRPTWMRSDKEQYMAKEEPRRQRNRRGGPRRRRRMETPAS